MVVFDVREERPGALAALCRWLEEHGWFDLGAARRLARGTRFAVDEDLADAFVARARGLGLRVTDGRPGRAV